jgi:rubrerythrin
LKKVTDDATAFDFAIQREFESILYYQEVRPLLQAAQQPIIDAIIAEERRHFTVLTERKKTLRP